MVGMHGSVAANRAIQHADLIIALGARFSDRVAQDTKTWGHSARILQVDIDNSEINKNVMIDKSVIANVHEFLEKAIPFVEKADHSEWRERTVSWKKKAPYVKATDCPLHPKDIMTIISEFINDDAYFVTDVGQHLPIITVILNNSVLGMVYQWQTIFYDRRYSNTTPHRKVDYVKVAEGFSIKGFRATTPEEFQDAFCRALQEDGPVWIECVISQDERVLPMIPGGKSVDDMIVG